VYATVPIDGLGEPTFISPLPEFLSVLIRTDRCEFSASSC
jgi:hypothetical protein